MGRARRYYLEEIGGTQVERPVIVEVEADEAENGHFKEDLPTRD